MSKKFKVTSSLAATFNEEVTANNKAEARALVEEGNGAGLPELCHHCAKLVDIDDFDKIIDVEPVDGVDEDEDEDLDEDLDENLDDDKEDLDEDEE